MAENSAIAWTDDTFNPWWGCLRVGPGCDNCYAATLDKRLGGDHWDGEPSMKTGRDPCNTSAGTALRFSTSRLFAMAERWRRQNWTVAAGRNFPNRPYQTRLPRQTMTSPDFSKTHGLAIRYTISDAWRGAENRRGCKSRSQMQSKKGWN